ncbi:MAG: CehA/McbA family metallohydrolase [Planctomycetes bacterium]|nr:CehA/McbA family metallohydrolase [Planctomycetota bacterium]MCH9779384.1 CehA/McbA family metallohydrolase [Planctomycetota bacterium]MCH9792753.1 CehA/McbA family metallohydrolase [Planctomycetota bacterium]
MHLARKNKLNVWFICLLFSILCLTLLYQSASADLALLQKPRNTKQKSPKQSKQPLCNVTLRLVEIDQSGNKNIVPGMLRILDNQGIPIPIPNLLNRGKGVKASSESEQKGIYSWSVVPQEVQIQLPQTRLTLQTISGLETERTQKTIDFTNKSTHDVTLVLKRFSNLSSNYKTANTHLHIMKLNRAECNQYLKQIPAADRLDLVFISHLERAIADKEYITNRYTKSDLKSLSRESGILFGWGEEHRHNSSGYDEGYGHVMLLNIKKLIQPVSIGPGIMKQGTDGIPLARGINTALRDQATAIWCHNAWGIECTPNVVQGNIHALNIFDGGTRSSYENSFYQYLNAGYKIPFSTGTDWFQYDFSRVYAAMKPPLTVATWLEHLKAGQTFITNGPLLDLQINNKTIGDQLKLSNEKNQITIRATGKGRIDFERLELIHNGKVIKTQKTTPVENHFEARFEFKLKINQPGWIALRTPSPSVPPDPKRQQKTPLNEYGRELFSHTSPVYLEWEGETLFDMKQARALLAEMKQSRDKIAKRFLFADEHERAHVLDVYSDGIEELSRQIKAQ